MELEKLCAEESLYKSLYSLLPEEWERPVKDWDEMIYRFHKNRIIDIPQEAPSTMRNILTEADFFQEGTREVVCFNNLRYCPPFLHQLEFIKIIYCMRGQVTVYLNDVRYVLEKGNICIVTPGIRHTVFSYHDEDMIINVLIRVSSFAETFSGILMEQNILGDFFWKILYTRHSNRMLIFRCRGDRRLDRWVERMFDESARGGETSSLLMKSYAMIFLGLIMREHLEELEVVEKLSDEIYVLPAIVQTIRNNLKSVTLEDLCIRFGMSEGELKRYIIRESGFTYSYLLRDMRLRRAAWLLQNTGYSVERIMEETGYSNIANFYKTFREYFGRTPSEYRKNGGKILI